MKKYTYTIYQVKATQDFSFMGWKMANKRGWSFDPYHVVWDGSEEAKDDYDLLNYLFEIFNTNHPVGFRGHSMSVNDIVKVCNDGSVKYYYCDSFGWENITDKCGIGVTA